MIADERVREYIHSLEPDENELCREIARKAKRDRIPIIKKETAALPLQKTADRPGSRSRAKRWYP